MKNRFASVSQINDVINIEDILMPQVDNRPS